LAQNPNEVGNNAQDNDDDATTKADKEETKE